MHKVKAMQGIFTTLTRLMALATLLLLAPLGQSPEAAQDVDTSNIRAEKTPVGHLIRIPVITVKINDFITMASGLANIYLITTPEGNVLVDTGFAHQDIQRKHLAAGRTHGGREKAEERVNKGGTFPDKRRLHAR